MSCLWSLWEGTGDDVVDQSPVVQPARPRTTTPSRGGQPAVAYGTMPEMGSLPMMSSTTLNAVGVRPSNVARKKMVAI